MPSHAVFDVWTVAEEVQNLVSSPTEPLAPLVLEALAVIDQALDTHGTDHVSLSFNGGKDCTVLLHLFVAALARRLPRATALKPIPTLYISTPSPFPALEEFIHRSTETYNLDLFHCTPPQDPESPTQPLPVESVTRDTSPSRANGRQHAVGKAKGGEGMRRALEVYKSQFPHIEAILIGTRRADPHGATLGFVNPTDPDWPRFERVHPIINWGYSDIWAFLLKLRVPYCCLYDQGYTSLGSTYNTFRNPALLIAPSCDTNLDPTALLEGTSPPIAPSRSPVPQLSSGTSTPGSDSLLPATPANAEERYRPAYDLVDGSLERAGRGKRKPSSTESSNFVEPHSSASTSSESI